MFLYSVNLVLCIVLSVISKGMCNNNDPKSSLVFVIDKTQSMSSVIEKVKEGANAIFDTVTKSTNSPIENFVLVFFGDPNVSEALITTDRDIFKSTLYNNTRSLEDGGECLDLSMTGIKTAMEASLSGSYVYVFTDSFAMDSDKFMEVKRIAQEKEYQVTFVLAEMCEDETPVAENYMVYPQLAEVTSGQVFHVRERHVNKILRYVQHYIASPRVTLYVNSSHPAGNENLLNITADDKMKDFTVSITTTERRDDSEIKATIIKPNGDTADVDAIVKLEEIVILSVPKLSVSGSGTYRVVFSSNVPAYVVVTAQSEVKFRHGFSTNLVSSLKNTVFSPFSETENLLIIQLYGEEVKLTTVKLLSQHNHTLIELPLGLYNKKDKLYVSKPFYPPSSKFRIAVKGINTVTNSTFTRLGSMILETGLVKGRPPKAHIKGSSKRTVKYRGNIELSCVVDVDPYSLPKVFNWKNADGKLLTNFYKGPSSSTYKTVSLKRLTRSETYECYVENAFGRDSKKVFVEVKPKFVLPRIKYPQETEMYVNPGKTIELPCKLLQGKPKPKITWYFKSQLNPFKYKELRRYVNQEIISIKNLNMYDTGTYTCVAKNNFGWDQLTFHVYVQRKPSVRLNATKEMVVKKNDVVNIECSVKAVPIAKVSWLKNGAIIGKTEKITIYRNEHMRFKAEEHHTGTYTCQAENKLGLASKSVKITVYSINITYPESIEYKLSLGDQIHLPCEKYINGVPKLTYLWMFSNSDTPVIPVLQAKSLDGKISIINSNLEIKRIEPNQRGYYTCVAKNAAYLENITFAVDVMFPASEDKTRTRSYSAVVGDSMLKIFCNIIGYPEPTFVWTKNRQALPPVHDKIKYEKSWLKIYNVSIEDAGYYSCIGNSTKFNKTVEAQIRVNVNGYPYPELIDAKTNRPIEKGSRALIGCLVPHSELDKITWFKDKKLIQIGKLELINAKVSDTGVYTCRVSNLHSSVIKSANVNVIVGFRPEFSNTPSEELDAHIGQNVSLDCSASAEPKVTVSWWHNKELKESVSDIVYNFTIQKKTEGQYTCIINNIFGQINRTFNINFKDCVLQFDTYSQNQPLMLTTRGKWPDYITAGGNTTIPIFDKLRFSCSSSFTNFESKDLRGFCCGGTKFCINKQVLDYADIKCSDPIRPQQERNPENKPCQGNGTTTLQLNFKYGKYSKEIDIFEYCLDEHSNSLYAKYIMKSPAGYFPNSTEMWDRTKLNHYSCDKQKKKYSSFSFDSTKCCFAKRYLVSPRDVFPGPLQRATFNRLNIVPHWSTCHSENWNELEKKVRNLNIPTKNHLIIYTGIEGNLTLTNKRGYNTSLYLKRRQSIPKYIWKVVQNPATKSSIAIIQLNVPEVTISEVSSYKLCTDICHKISWLRGTAWSDVEKGFTFCCSLQDFKDNFDGIRNIPFEPYFDLLNT